MHHSLGKKLRDLPGPVLVTGHTGFKGTWLTLLLEKLDVPVVGLSLPALPNSLFERTNRFGVIQESFTDIRDFESVLKFVESTAPSVVIHMAAQPLVFESYKTPRETFEVNVMGSVNVLSASFEVGSVEAIGVITTDKVYRNDNSGRAFVETDALEGKDPYSASKVGTEATSAAWRQIAKVSGGPKVISLRAGNVLGGGDWAENRLLPDLIRGYANGFATTVRNPQSTRPWQHVLDPLRGYILALEALVAGTSIEVQEESLVSTVKWWDNVLNKFMNPSDACQIDIEFMLENMAGLGIS
ncbi:MAG: CDP-glucose 4,6-dehydratase [Actinobacteria bacterium]|nr:CDP-glucose 4,6-dehydratase [Actinomycetota bacterium]